MALIIADRIKETSTTTGTGAISLGGAVTGFKAFSSVCANGDTAYYTIQAVDGSGVPTADWECGIGTWNTGNTFTRTTVLSSSNSNSAVSFTSGTKEIWIDASASFLNSLGDKGIPQVSKSAAYTIVVSDRGKHIFHPSADTTARTFTIPSNASVAFGIGTAITFVNQNGAGVVTIAITSDTMRLAGSGVTGSRTLSANGVATALKITATEWIISGTGLS